MSDVFFEEMDIPKPDYNLGVSGGTHGQMTGQMLIKLEEVFLKEQPDMVLLFGDTNSTMAAALAAVKLHIPVCHVEAGKPCVTVLDFVVWTETMQDGCNVLAKPEKEYLLSKANRPVVFDPAYQPFGDGHSAEKVVYIIKEYLN